MKKLEKDVVDMKTKKPIEPTTRQVKSQPKRAASVGDPEHMRSKMTDVQAKTPPAARTTPSQQLWGKNKTPDDSDAKIRAALDRQAKAKPDLGKSDDSHLNLAMAHEPGSNVHRNLAAMPNLSPEAAKYLHKVNKPGSLVHQHLALNPITKSLGKSDEKPDTSHEEAMHIARTDDPGSYAHYRLAKDPNISPEVAMHLAKVNEPGSVIHSALAASPNIIYEVASHLAKVNSPGSDVHHLLGKNPNTMLGKSDEKGVHQDTEHKGKSLAGLKTDASNSRKATNQKGDKAIAAAWNSKAKDDHKKVLSEMKAMPKPDLGKSDYHKRDEGVNKQASGPDKKGVSEAGVYVRGGDKQRAKIEHEKTRAEQKYMDKPDLGKSDDTSKIAKPDHITDSTWKNSGQQGRHPDHADNPHHDTLTRHGYKYSHSTPITRQDGTKYTHHTYKKGNHNVGIDRASGSWKWNASRTGSGRTYRGRDDKQLDKYLKGHGARNKTPNLGKSLEKSLTTPAHSAHGKLAAMLSKLRGTSLDKSEDDQDPASAHLAEIVQTLDDCLRTCTDEQAQEKISLAKDYLSALMAHLQYEPEMHSALTDLMHNGPESKGV